MGNYKYVEIDFVERTLELIAQYEGNLHRYEYAQQYNFTLLINCLLGIIVLPKEIAISYLPKDKLTDALRADMGIVGSQINPQIDNLHALIVAMRHSIAHFLIEFESMDSDQRIDRIIFKDDKKGANYVVASFLPTELLAFTRYYGGWFVSSVKKHKRAIYGIKEG